jgi:hypothetical protein
MCEFKIPFNDWSQHMEILNLRGIDLKKGLHLFAICCSDPRINYHLSQLFELMGNDECNHLIQYSNR